MEQIDSLREVLGARYAIRREIGRSAMAAVFEARDASRSCDIALKVLRGELLGAVGAARFAREIAIASRLEHANIVPVLDSGDAAGQPYYTMPLIVGETLRDRLRREPQLSLATTIAIAQDIAAALDYAHAQGVVHRDVKPANILLDGNHALVVDFGIAHAMSVAASDRLTESGIAIGTPEYMSPEQGESHRDLDGRSDVYALGCVVYEMLAGEPPFTGPTVQAVIARHCHEAPRSLRIVRPSLTSGVQRAVEKALAKVPADRYSHASTFVADLKSAAEQTEDNDGGTRARKERFLRVATATLAAVAALAIYAWRQTAVPALDLDPNRIVVFPLRDGSAGAAGANDGEAVATYIGYALDGTRPLKWLEGLQLAGPARRDSADRMSPRETQALSRRAGAAYFIDGSIVRGADSVTVVLRLHSVAGDSIVLLAGAGAPARAASTPSLGLAAVGRLLPALLEPGRNVDVSALSERHPEAIANFLQGEREYRRMRFAQAIVHYHASLSADSGLALAALKGAEAANWEGRFGEDTQFIGAALRRKGALPPRLALLAEGLQAYLTGAADSAVSRLRRAVALDPTSAISWTLLAESYGRLLPNVTNADSLSRVALRSARAADPDFAPALMLLQGDALLDGNIAEAESLDSELRRAGADSSHAVERRLMLRCVRDGPGAVDWRDAARTHVAALSAVGKTLAVRASQAACARAAFEAVLSADSAARNYRWGAVVGLHGLLIATGKRAEIATLFASRPAADLPTWSLHLIAATADSAFDSEARAAVAGRGTAYTQLTASNLWALGAWAARDGALATATAIARALRAKRDSSHARGDSIMVRAVDARIALAAGDTAGAIDQLKALVPSAPRNDLAWRCWESLGGERLLLAELLYARGTRDEAERVAKQLDASEPVCYLVFLRKSIELRLAIARSGHQQQRITAYSARLAGLGGQQQ